MKRNVTPKNLDADRRPIAKQYIKDLALVAEASPENWKKLHKAINEANKVEFTTILTELGLDGNRIKRLGKILWPPKDKPTEACW